MKNKNAFGGSWERFLFISKKKSSHTLQSNLLFILLGMVRRLPGFKNNLRWHILKFK